MFGNLIGWLISAGITVLTAAGLFFMQRQVEHYATTAGVNGPVGLRAAELKVQPPTDPRSLATWMTDDADSSELWRQAISDFAEGGHREFLRGFKGDLESPTESGTYNANLNAYVKPKLELMLKARTMKRGSIFGGSYEQAITFEAQREPLTGAVRHLREAAEARAQHFLIQKGKAKEAGDAEGEKRFARLAREMYQAIFTMGVIAWEERVVHEELLMAKDCLLAAYFMPMVAEEGQDLSNYRDFSKQLTEYYVKQVYPVWLYVGAHRPIPNYQLKTPIWTGEYLSFNTWTADAIVVANKAGDPMWKVEATLALGRSRFAGLTDGELFAANQELNKLVNATDPRLKLAARRALDLTEPDYRKATAKIWQ